MQWQSRGGAAPSDLTSQGAASTAVIAALSFWDYSLMLPGGTESDAYKATGRCFSVAAGRISYVHGFKGAQLLCVTLWYGSRQDRYPRQLLLQRRNRLHLLCSRLCN